MAWDQKILPDAFLASALAAATAAPGGEDAAFMAHIQTGIGSSWKRQLLRDDTVVFEGTGTGLLPYVNRVFTVPGVTKSSISNADIDTGEWVHRIVHASDATKAISNLVTKTGGAGPGLLSGDLVSPNDVAWGAFTVVGPSLGSLSLTLLAPTGVTDTTFTLRAEVAGSIPAGAVTMIQWTDNETAGPWRESARVSTVAGTFSALFTGAPAGTVIFWRAFVFTDPTPIHSQTVNASFTTTGTAGGGIVPTATLAAAYATCMTSLNDFPPGNAGGQTSFENSTWPFSDYFQTRPYGSNVDPLRFGQVEPGGTSAAGFIVTRIVAAGRNGTAFSMWPWIMGAKGVLNAAGNWRVQIRDHQTAVKVDALTNPWSLIYGPAQLPSYGLNNLGGLRVSALLDNFNNTNGRSLFDMNTNPTETRSESSGGVSFKNFSISTTDFQIELNVPDVTTSAAVLPASVTPDRCVAFAGCYWARIIADNSASPIPSGIQVGAMLGVDFFDSSGRIGTPGQSRLVQLTTEWKPIVFAFVLDPATSGPRQPYSPAAIGTWLTANPPPFV